MSDKHVRLNRINAGTFLLACVALCLCLFAAPRVARAQDMPDNGIPVLSITLEGLDGETASDAFDAINASPDHSVERGGVLQLDVPEGYDGDYGEAPSLSAEIDAMRGRGNSTWNQSKKPYKIKLDKATDLLGMGANKHWVLLANSMDTSFLRNRIASYIGDRLGLAFTPRMLPVDLVVNGAYQGSYYLSEQVRVGSSRVDIDELSPTDTEEPAVTGGYLLAMAPKQDEPAENRITTSRGVRFCGDDPSFAPGESGTDEQKEYLSNYLQKVEDAIYGDDFSDAEGVRWSDYMDLTSTATFWWVQEYTGNSPDAYWTPSTYLYKEREGKLYWGPLWDFDQSMQSDTSGLTYTTTPWLDYLRSFDPVYQQELRDS